MTNKNYVDDNIGNGTLVGFIQTIGKSLKLSVEYFVYNPKKYWTDQSSITPTIVYQKPGGYLLEKGCLKSSSENINGDLTKFLRSTKTSSLTRITGTSILPAIGYGSMFIETCLAKSGNENVLLVLKEQVFSKLVA